MSEPRDNKIIQFATNEWLLLLYRAITTVGITIGVAQLEGIKKETVELRGQFHQFQINYAERIGRVEGELGQVKGVIAEHRNRLNGFDGDIRETNRRLIDMMRPPANRTQIP